MMTTTSVFSLVMMAKRRVRKKKLKKKGGGWEPWSFDIYATAAAGKKDEISLKLYTYENKSINKIYLNLPKFSYEINHHHCILLFFGKSKKGVEYSHSILTFSPKFKWDIFKWFSITHFLNLDTSKNCAATKKMRHELKGVDRTIYGSL